MSVSLIGKDGSTAATDANPVPVVISTRADTRVSFNRNDFTLDSFDRLRVSEPRIAFEYSFSAQTPTTASTIWEATAFGAGTEALTTNLFGTNLTTTTATSTGRWIQAYNHVRYAPGISTLLRFTFNLNTPTSSNLRQRIGMFTDQGTFPSTAGDGLFFENDSGVFSFVRRYMTQGASGTEERVNQAIWNKDKLNGTGASGVSLDFTKTQHLLIEFQHLGVGTIRFGFDTSQGVIWCHEMSSVNVLAEAWARTGSLPVRAECYNYGAGVINNLTLINCVVIQEGDVQDQRGWRYFSSNSGTTIKLGGTAAGFYPLLSLRAASTNDLTKRARIVPTKITIVVAVVATGATSLQCALLLLPTPNTGATFGVSQGGSVTTVDQAATAATAVTGSITWSAVIPNVVGSYTFDIDNRDDNASVIGYNAAGTVSIAGSSVLMLAAGPLTGTASAGASIAASLTWKELV
jgi:hypothetical protein